MRVCYGDGDGCENRKNGKREFHLEVVQFVVVYILCVDVLIDNFFFGILRYVNA